MIENNLSREAKARAAAPGENSFRFAPLIKCGRSFQGINWDDRDALFDLVGKALARRAPIALPFDPTRWAPI